MDVFPEVLGEKEFSYFPSTTYYHLSNVLNDSLAKQLKAYMANPDANQAVVSHIKENLGDTIESLTMHFTLQEKGIPELIQKLTPDTLLTSGIDLDEVIEKLTFLEDNYSKVLTSIPSRTKDQWLNFRRDVNEALGHIYGCGEQPTYPNIMERLDANSFMFYTPNEKPHGTKVSIINLKKRQWMLALKGARYAKRCDAEGIPYLDRRKF